MNHRTVLSGLVLILALAVAVPSGTRAQEAPDPYHEAGTVPPATPPADSSLPSSQTPAMRPGAPSQGMGGMMPMPMMGMQGMGCMGAMPSGVAMPGMAVPGMQMQPMGLPGTTATPMGMPAMPVMMGMMAQAGAPGSVTENPVEAGFMAINRRMHREMSLPSVGDADVDFARAMVAHHQGAIDMAKLVLAFGDDPEIRKLAESVIAAQSDEIRILEDWLKRTAR